MSTVSARLAPDVTDRRATPRQRADWHAPILAADAAVCVGLGLFLVAVPGWLADGLGLATSLPVRLVGAAFLVAALVNAWAARDGRVLSSLLAVDLDLGFVVGAGAVLVAAPGDATGWARFLLVGTVALPAVLGALKVVGLGRARP